MSLFKDVFSLTLPHLNSVLFLFAAAIHSLKLSRNHVDWHSVDEVYLYSDATTSKIARTVTQKLGFSKGKSFPGFVKNIVKPDV